MFVNATNQLTRRSHIQFKAFTHENKTRKRNVIVYYYDEDFEYELCKPNKIIDLIIFMSAYSGTHTQTYISENLQSDDTKTTLNYFEKEY